MATRTLSTFEEFAKYPDDGQKHEFAEWRAHHLASPQAPPYPTSFNWLQPDVSFVRSEQMQRGDPNEYSEGAPALAIEVASESNSAAQLDLKMELYFAHGSEEVWVVYPKTRHVRGHFPDGHSKTLAVDLESALFPGWSAPLPPIFA